MIEKQTESNKFMSIRRWTDQKHTIFERDNKSHFNRYNFGDFPRVYNIS
jgi:hypothetical protein